MIEAISLSPIQYRWVYHIETTLKYLRAMVGNKARVEDASSKLFLLKKVSYFTSVYFTEEHIVYAPTM